MAEASEHSRLTRNFHRSFKPECRYINAMLRFAASGSEGDYQQIAAATGIPTGVSTGKVPAIMDYCRGMGLLELSGPARNSTKKPELTPFGRIVLLEDPFLKLPVTQWLAHLQLCSPLKGADVWYQTFFAGTQSLGMKFERTRLESHLGLIYGVKDSGLIGPMIGTYEDEASFKICGALSESAGVVQRKMAPAKEEMILGYGAWILQLMETHFSNTQQIPVTSLDSVAGWRTIPGWDISNLQRVLEMMGRKRLVDVDRHMEPWLIAPATDLKGAWKRIYDDLV